MYKEERDLLEEGMREKDESGMEAFDALYSAGIPGGLVGGPRAYQDPFVGSSLT